MTAKKIPDIRKTVTVKIYSLQTVLTMDNPAYQWTKLLNLQFLST